MKIALIADTHLTAAAGDFIANCETAIAWIDGIGADLVVHLGDITADGVEDPAQFAVAHKVLSRLGTPLLLVPGNHDIGDNPTPGAGAAHGLVRPDRLALYRQTFGADYWVAPAGDWSLIGLNAQLFGLGDAEEEAQFVWLEQTLAAVSGPIGLTLHKPLFRDAPEEGVVHPRYVPIAQRARLLALFAGHDLRFVVNGHTHQLRRLRQAGVDHLWAPSCAFVVPDVMQEWIGDKVVGVMVVTLEDAGHRFALHVLPGLAQYNLADYVDVFPKLRGILARAADARA